MLNSSNIDIDHWTNINEIIIYFSCMLEFCVLKNTCVDDVVSEVHNSSWNWPFNCSAVVRYSTLFKHAVSYLPSIKIKENSVLLFISILPILTQNPDPKDLEDACKKYCRTVTEFKTLISCSFWSKGML